jgi:cytochrome c553
MPVASEPSNYTDRVWLAVVSVRAQSQAAQYDTIEQHCCLIHVMKRTSLLVTVSLALSMSALQAADARMNWDGKCALCHGKEGKGDHKIGQKMGVRDFSDPKVQASLKDEQITKAIKEGLKKDGKEIMKPLGDKLTDPEIKALVAYLRGLKGK